MVEEKKQFNSKFPITKGSYVIIYLINNVIIAEMNLPKCHENAVECDERTYRIVRFEGSYRMLDC